MEHTREDTAEAVDSEGIRLEEFESLQISVDASGSTHVLGNDVMMEMCPCPCSRWFDS